MRDNLLNVFVLIFFLGIAVHLISPQFERDGGYKTGTYFIQDAPVVLVDGYSEKTDEAAHLSIITRYLGNETWGDLNNDGQEDVVFVITQNTGGTGTFYYVVAALKTADGFQGTNAVLLGDRINIKDIEIEEDKIQIRILTRSFEEPMVATPTFEVIRHLKIRESYLEIIAE